MKTASTSQSYILAVSSRENENQDYNRRAWDIPWMESNGWQLRVPNPEIFPENIMSNVENTSGTAVLLYDLSRMKTNINQPNTFDRQYFKLWGECRMQIDPRSPLC